MGRALIIGAGGVANVVVHKCCQHPDVFEEICIASRTLSKCDAIRDSVGETRTVIRTAAVDADHAEQVVALIRSFAPDIVIHVALVFVVGFFNSMRSMITGRYAIEVEGDAA